MKALNAKTLAVLVLPLLLLSNGCGGGGGGGDATTVSTGATSALSDDTLVSADTVPLSRLLLPTPSVSTEQSVVDGVATLGLEMMNTLPLNGSSPRNEVVAPFTQAKSLARLIAGAAGQTQTSLCSHFHLSTCPTELDAVFDDLDLGITGRIAGSALDGRSSQMLTDAVAQAHYGFKRTYLDTLSQNYGTNFQIADFAGDLAAAEDILNSWGGQAYGLWFPGDTSINTRLVLGDIANINAAWKVPFDSSLTASGTFMTLDSRVVKRVRGFTASPYRRTAVSGHPTRSREIQRDIQFNQPCLPRKHSCFTCSGAGGSGHS